MFYLVYCECILVYECMKIIALFYLYFKHCCNLQYGFYFLLEYLFKIVQNCNIV